MSDVVHAPQRVFVIGDIHGCAAALDRLLELLVPGPSDVLITLGDYIDRGTDSARVLDRLIEVARETQLVPLLGNHEILMLMALEDSGLLELWLQSGGQTTLDSYGGDLKHVPQEHIEFLKGCRRLHVMDRHFFVHANYAEKMPWDRQPEFSLFWEHLHLHLPGPHVSGKRAVLGHTPQRKGQPLVLDHLICLDTYCYGGGWLTAVDLIPGHYWQSDSQGNLRSQQPQNLEKVTR